MGDSSGTEKDGSEPDAESTAPTVSQSQFQGERLNKLQQFLNENGGDQQDFATAVVSVFDIQCSEMETYLALLEHQESTATELAEILDGDRSATSRRLKSLMEKDLVSRERRVTGKRGTAYEYTAKSLEETTEWMKQYIEGWSNGVAEQLTTIQERYPEDSQEDAA